MEKTQLAKFKVKISNYYRFVHCIFIKSKNDDTNFQTIFNTFCQQYSITQKDEIYSLLESMKNDNKAYKNFKESDPSVIGSTFLFIIYYLKNKSGIFYNLNNVLLLMKVTCNARFNIKCARAQILDDNSRDAFIEKTIDEQERIENLIKLSKDIEELTQQINDTTLYEIETKINDHRYLQFIVIDVCK